MIVGVYFTILVIIMSSCSHMNMTGSSKRAVDSNNREVSQQDYIDHLTSIGDMYLNSPNTNKIKLDSRGKNYLRSLSNNILTNNIKLFPEKKTVTVNIIDSKRTFLFSLPNLQIFLSSKLIDKYIKNEEILVAVLTNELIKSYHSMYKKNIIVPTGYIKLDRLLSLTRVPVSVKMMINKWSYLAMQKAGHDPLALLHWIQVQNKNSLDFVIQHGETYKISREEFQLKHFIAQERINSAPNQKEPRSSSKDFYHLTALVEREHEQ